ncbi:MAG: transcriptional regulator [Leptospira sp.]|nr:transcriptional regulator [Leptospira sp.]
MRKISHWLMSLRFLIGLQSKNISLPDIETLDIPIRNGSLIADIYRPLGRSKGLILTINGLAPLGNRDPRFILVNKSLCNLGFTVISTFYDEICDFKISLRNIEDIKDSISYITGDKNVSPQGKLSIFAPSFSGSLSLIAASDLEIANNLNTICTIGAYGNVETIIQNLFSNQELDEYGRMILLLNFLPISIGKNDSLFTALKLAIIDNYFKYKDNLLEPHYLQMSKENRDLFDQLKMDRNFRIKHWNIILKKGGENRILLTKLSVTNYLDTLSLPILFIHGEKDDVVPANESIMLYNHLSSRGLDCKLCVTNLISHGDTGFSLKILLELPKLVNSFSFFFKHTEIKSSREYH